jgi:hypothetical protein
VKKLAWLLIGVVACAPPKDTADTTTLAAPDTVKPAPAPVQDAARTATKTKASASTKGTKGLGRDSVIRFDLKDPRRNLPRADSTKKPLTSTDSATLANKPLGRDSVIRFDLSDPRRQLPKADTAKKKPPQ